MRKKLKRIFIPGLSMAIFCASHSPYASAKTSCADSRRRIASCPVVEGILIDLSLKKKFLIIQTFDGRKSKISVNKSTEFIDAQKVISLSDLLPGDRLEIIYDPRQGKKSARSVQIKSSGLRRKYYNGYAY